MTQAEALCWTWFLELPLVLMLGSHWRLPVGRLLLAGLLASGITHPLAWSHASSCSAGQWLCSWWGIECAVTGFEAGFYWRVLRLGWLRAALLSLCTNGFSALTGTLL